MMERMEWIELLLSEKTTGLCLADDCRISGKSRYDRG